MDIERLPNEGYVEYAHRLIDAVNDGVMNWQELSDAIIGVGAYTGETCVKNGRFLRRFLEKCGADHENSLEKCDSEDKSSLEKMRLERKKLQDATRELNELYRVNARNELNFERLKTAIDGLPKIEVGEYTPRYESGGNVGLLLFSDVHAGSTYELCGLHGEIINEYNWDVMKSRMNQMLFDMQNSIAKGVEFDKLIIGCLGDFIENILRESSLAKLREPVIDTVIKFSEYYAQWLAEMYKVVKCPMVVVTIGGNHDIARPLTSKPQFEQENLAKIIREFLYLRLKDIDGIEIREYAEFDVLDICGVNVGFSHGTDKDLSMAMDYFSNLYDVSCDELYAGHYHGNAQTSNGITALGDRMCTRIGSICGLDTYSHKLRKAAKPSYYFALYDTWNGKTWNRVFYLN